MSEKKIPNPNGRKGGEKHQKLGKQVFDEIEKKGLFAKFEHFIRLITGQGRFMDLAGFDENGNEVEYHQIGKQTKKGLPVKRERDVIEEVEKYKGIQIEFHPYNIEEEEE